MQRYRPDFESDLTRHLSTLICRVDSVATLGSFFHTFEKLVISDKSIQDAEFKLVCTLSFCPNSDSTQGEVSWGCHTCASIALCTWVPRKKWGHLLLSCATKWCVVQLQQEGIKDVEFGNGLWSLYYKKSCASPSEICCDQNWLFKSNHPTDMSHGSIQSTCVELFSVNKSTYSSWFISISNN